MSKQLTLGEGFEPRVGIGQRDDIAALLHYSPTMRGCLATPNFGQISALESVPIGGVRAQSVG